VGPTAKTFPNLLLPSYSVSPASSVVFFAADNPSGILGSFTWARLCKSLAFFYCRRDAMMESSILSISSLLN
jgi:hypothetical protein